MVWYWNYQAEFLIILLSIFKDPLEKMNSIQEQMWNFSREMGTFFKSRGRGFWKVKEISRQRKMVLYKDVTCDSGELSVYSLWCFSAPYCECVVHSCYLWGEKITNKRQKKKKQSLQTVSELEKSVAQKARLIGKKKKPGFTSFSFALGMRLELQVHLWFLYNLLIRS